VCVCEAVPCAALLWWQSVVGDVSGVLLQVRIILNKSDQVDQQQLMRVYGALMWSLGKVFKSPEVCKVRSHCWWCCLACWCTVLHISEWPLTPLLLVEAAAQQQQARWPIIWSESLVQLVACQSATPKLAKVRCGG
jgi:hypothetical protein